MRTIISLALVAYALYKVAQKRAAVEATKPAAQPGPQSVTGAPPSALLLGQPRFPRPVSDLFSLGPRLLKIDVNNRW